MIIFGIMEKVDGGIKDFEISLKSEFKNDNFQLFSSEKPFISSRNDSYFGVFGYLFNSLETINKRNSKYLSEGYYLAVDIDSSGNVSITTDPNCRIDLYFSENENFIVFSNDITAITEIKGMSLELDQISLAHSLSIYGSRPPKKRTFFKEIRRLGYEQVLNLNNGELSLRTHSPNISPVNNQKSETQFLEEYSHAFLEALEIRSSNTQNVVFFSSGWDSTAIAAGLVKLKGRKNVKCVIGEMIYSKSSGLINKIEVERAEKICSFLGIELVQTKFDYADQIPENFEEIREFLKVNQIPSIPAINHFQLSRFASNFAKDDVSVFAGEMSDGAHNLGFAQYTSVFHPNSIDFREYSDKMRSYLFGPSFVKFASKDRLQSDPVWNYLSERIQIDFEAPVPILQKRIEQHLVSFFLRNTRMPFVPRSELNLLTKNGSKDYENTLINEYFTELESYFSTDNMYSIYLHLYNSFHWQGSTVNSIEIAGNYFHLKVNNPFHDNKLIELLKEMPEEYGRGLDLKTTKYPLKWTLEKVLNYDLNLNGGLHSYLYDENPNFSHSEEILFRSAFQNEFKSHLKKSKLLEELDPAMFNVKHMYKIVEDYTMNKKSKEITNLLSICMYALVI